MTISEIIQRIRLQANDDGAVRNRPDSYYINLVIAAIGDLEPHMGKLSIRDDNYQFTPLRGADREVLYKADGVTPEIDSTIYYDPDDADEHSPENIHVNRGLRLASGKDTGSIQTALFLDAYSLKLEERDIAFIKIDADVNFTAPDGVEFDVSLDGRETWLVDDYGLDLTLESGTTDFVDVSKIPSSYPVLKWKLTGATALVRNTVLWRYYISRDQLRHYSSDVVELAKLRLLEIRLDNAIKNQNDPMVIGGIQEQIRMIQRKYGLDKWTGDTMPSAGGIGIDYYPESRAERKVFGLDEQKPEFLKDRRIIGITSDGEIRRT